MENIGLAHEKPLVWIAACYAMGAAAAGARMQATGTALVIAAIICAAASAARGIRDSDTRGRVRVCACGLAAALAAVIGCARCGAVLSERERDYAELDGKDVALICEIKSGVEWREDGELLVEAEPLAFAGEESAQKIGGRVLLSFDVGAESPVDWGEVGEKKLRGALSYGSRVEARGKIRKPARQQNSGLFDYAGYLYSRGLSATLSADADGLVSCVDGVDGGGGGVDGGGGDGGEGGWAKKRGAAPSLIGLGLMARERAEKALYAALPARDAALLSGVALGKDDGVDRETREGFAAAGLLHLLAVSGTHVGIAASATAYLAAKAGAGARTRGALSLVCVTAFAFVAGFSASVTRASVACAAAIGAKFANRGYDSLSACGLAALILLVHNPAQVFSAGFALSFACAVSIVVLSPAVRAMTTRVRLPGAIKGQFAIAVSVAAGVTPLLINIFHSLPLLSVPANILASPIIAATLCLAQLSALLGAVVAPLGMIPAVLAESCVGALRIISGAAAAAPAWLTPRPGSLGAPLMIAWYAALCALAACASKISSRKTKVMSVAAAGSAGIIALCFAIYGSVAAASRMEIVFLDVGNANAAYIEIGGRRSIIVDAGGPAWISFSQSETPTAPGSEAKSALASENGLGFGERRLSDYLIARGVGEIDVAIATHGDADHASGFYAALDSVRIKTLLIPYAKGRDDEENLTALSNKARACGTLVEEIGAGDVIRLCDDSYIETLSPQPPPVSLLPQPQPQPPPPPVTQYDSDWRRPQKSNANDLSLVLSVSFGESRALFCGDIGAQTEAELIRSGKNLDADVISTPHHGSKYSSSAEFVEAVSPLVAVTGTGRNSYGHPSPIVAARYEAVGASFLRTDRDGMVTVYCHKDGSLSVSRYNE